MADWSYLSPAEYEKISSVLKRDRELRSLEEIRIKQLKQELVCLRKRATLRPGLDSQRNCARCLNELGRIINRGALCPLCNKKVCKECRHYGDENHEWLCVCCYKQMQLKAVSGEWMQDFSKLSVRKCANDPPGDQLRKVLHESQRKGLFDPDAEQRKPPAYETVIPPEKPPRSFQCEQPPANEDSQIEAAAVKGYSTDVITTAEIEKKQSDFPNLSPKVLPRVSPWNGIDPEPTIPRRIDQSRPFGAVQQYEYPLENHAYRERQSSDEGHCTIGCRSRSTSSEVVDESENLTPVPLPRKRLSPLKKQQAIPEPSAVENQQSSVDTVDSGVFSPGLKLENSVDGTAPPSPLAVSRLSSVEQETVEHSSTPPPLLTQSLAKDSSSSENEANKADEALPTKTSDTLFRKVTLKKRKYSSGPKALKEKRSSTLSADVHPLAPPSGLNCSFSNNNKSYIPFNSNNNTNSKRKLTRFHTNVPNSSKIKPPITSSSLIPKLKNKEALKFSNSRKHVEISLGSTLPNSEALCDGRIQNLKTDRNHKKDVHSSPGEDRFIKPVQKCRIPRDQVLRRTREHRRRSLESKEKQIIHGKNYAIEAHSKKVVQTKISSDSNFIPKCSKRVYKQNVKHPSSTNQLSENDSLNTLVLRKVAENFKEFKSVKLQCFSEYPTRLFRSASLPNRRTFVKDWLHSWLWRCHSLEDWLWYMDEQPYETRNFNQINILPDDYKLVYVSSSSISSDSDECFSTKSFHVPISPIPYQNFNFNRESNLRVHSHIKMNYDTSYMEDSDWELESNGGDEFDLTFTAGKSKALIQVSEANNFFVHHNLHTDAKWDHEQKQHCSSKVKKSRCRSHHSTISHDFWLQETLLTKLILRKSVYIKMNNLKPFTQTICLPSFKNYSKLFLCYQLNFYLTQLIRKMTSAMNCGIKTDTAVDTSTRCLLPVSTYTEYRCLIVIQLNDKNKSKTSSIIYISLKDFVAHFFSMIHSIPAQKDTLIKVVPDIFGDKILSRNCNSFNFYNFFYVPASLPPYPCLPHLQSVFLEVSSVFSSYLFQNNAVYFQSRNVCERMLIGAEKKFPVALCYGDYEINRSFKSNVHSQAESLLYSLSLNRLKILSEKGIISCAVSFHIKDPVLTNKDASISILNKTSECSKLYSKYNKCFKEQLKSNFIPTHEERCVVKSNVISLETKRSLAAGRCGSKIDFLPQYKFRNPTWRREKAGNPLDPGDGASPPELTNRSRNQKALVTGWEQERCCIARRRVIDLLGALCGREVLADLTALLECAGIRVSSSAKHGGRTVDAFFYDAPPVARKPEAGYLFRLTRSDPRLLFQLGTSFESGVVARMLTIKSATAGVQADYVDKICHQERGKGVGAMEIEETKSPVETVSQCGELAPPHGSRSSGGDSKKLVRTPRDIRTLEACCGNVNTLYSSPNTADVGHSDTFDLKTIKDCVEFNSNVSEIDFNHDKAEEFQDSLYHWDSEVLSCVKNIFCQDSCYESSVSYESVATDFHPLICENERVDCKCNKPCYVPSSPSVVDATVDVRSFAEDGEILSSGDELDKIESDTDSQDTVIEGEAYKRIRSVAIKEKILHANEELFGVDCKEYDCESHKFSSTETTERNSNTRFDIEEITRKALQSFFLEDHQTDIPKFLCSSLQENKTFETYSSEHHFQPFKKTELSAFHPVSPSSFVEKKKDHEFSDCRNFSSESSSYKKSYCENVCSSESSDNGSDGEEVLLSDTSTSSDEATYIAPSSGFRYYNQPLSYRLHTIVEESCEESERSSRGATPTSRANSEFEYYDKARVASSKNTKKVIRKPIADNIALGHTKNVKSCTSYAVLATSRLEKYFKSGLLEGEMSYPEDDLTDESGGISSDDDVTNVHLNDKLKNESISTKLSIERQNRKTVSTTNDKSTVKFFSNASPGLNVRKKYTTYSDIVKKSERKKNDSKNTFHKLEPSTSNPKQIMDTEPSDEDAKYIMSHLMQHISNDTEDKIETAPDAKDVSPMLKILESEIARLMLTVSPASLSAGEPSSSCSSTIGSNNSDYGSDTLESAEETTSDEEINAEIVPENRALVELVPQNDTVSNVDLNEVSSTNIHDSSNASQIADSAVSEETLYICKQLMASLKKIADATEGTVASDEFSSNTEDHSAKQYITDQIISLMQTVSASHNSPLLRTLTLNTSHTIQLDSDISQGRSDSDSPSPNGEKRGLPKSKTPSESGSETTISASISIPSYDDSDRTPTESEISHEMDELYALLENNGTHQDIISAKFSYDLDAISQEKIDCLRCVDSPVSEGASSSDSCDMNSTLSESHSSLLSGAASKLESLLPITIEERIARYKKAFMTKTDEKESETRINVILPQPSKSNMKHKNDLLICRDSELPCFSTTLKAGESCDIMLYNSNASNNEDGYNITSVKIVSHNTYPLSSAIHKILSSNIDSKYLEQKLDYQIVNILDASTENTSCDNNLKDQKFILEENKELGEDSKASTIIPLPKVMNPKEKASSENDLLVANYRAKSKGSKVFGTKSVGNISELENSNSKSAFRDTGYYSFKSSEESFLSLDDSTASQTSTTSLTQYRSLTSTETIPEEEESCTKSTTSAKMSLSSSNIPDAVCDTSASKSSTLPLSLRNKLSGTPGGNHRSRSSFFSTSGVLRKLTQLRDESGNSLRSSPHGRLRMRNRSLSGGSEDGKHRKSSVPQISVSECAEIGHMSAASSEKDSSGIQEDEIDQAFAYHCRSQMSLSSFGGRSESVTSVYSAAGGGRYGTVTVTGEVLFGLIYNHKAGVLEINIKECRNLAAVDTKRNRSDPYVKAYLLPDRTKSGKRKTKVKKHTLNPSFDESLKFHVAINELVIRTLWLSVWHSDRFGRNDFLGEVMLPLGNDTIENSCSKWYPLQERLETLDTPVSYKGDLILALKYVPPDVTSRKFSKRPGILVKGALEVLVREAHNLMATRSNGTSDPFCKSYLLPDKSKSGKQKTPVFKKSCHPKWNHTFVYDDVSLDDLRERCLELTIWDYDKITSNDFLGGVRLCLGTGKYQGRDVDWMDSVGEERSLWYTMLERPNTWVDGSLLLRPNMQSRRMV